MSSLAKLWICSKSRTLIFRGREDLVSITEGVGVPLPMWLSLAGGAGRAARGGLGGCADTVSLSRPVAASEAGACCSCACGVALEAEGAGAAEELGALCADSDM